MSEKLRPVLPPPLLPCRKEECLEGAGGDPTIAEYFHSTAQPEETQADAAADGTFLAETGEAQIAPGTGNSTFPTEAGEEAQTEGTSLQAETPLSQEAVQPTPAASG